jgi:hypothetical protein
VTGARAELRCETNRVALVPAIAAHSTAVVSLGARSARCSVEKH